MSAFVGTWKCSIALLQLSGSIIFYVTLGKNASLRNVGGKVHQWCISPESFWPSFPNDMSEKPLFSCLRNVGKWMLMHLARDQNNALVNDAFRPQSSDSFASVSQIIMAEHMQIIYDLCSYHSFEITKLSNSTQ